MSDHPTICTLKYNVFSARHRLRRGTVVRCGELRSETRWTEGDPPVARSVAVRDVAGPDGELILCVDSEKLALGAPPELTRPSWSER